MESAVAGIAWIIPGFITAFFIAWTLLLVISRMKTLAGKLVRWEPGRNFFQPAFRRFGGLALVISFLVVVFLNDRVILTPAIGSILWLGVFVLFFGLSDDIRPVPWPYQLALQFVLALFLVVSGGFTIELMHGPGGTTWDFREWFPSMPMLAFVAWFLLIVNAMNWLDGLDGLLGGVSLVGFLSLFVVSLLPEVNQPALSFLTLVMAGGTLAFLLFNWPPASLLAGTVGAYFLGGTLATFAVVAGAKIATALLVLSIPVLDAFWVLWDRFRSRQPLFEPDRRHLHYRLIELGWSPRSVLLLYTGITMIMAWIALSTQVVGKLLAFGFVGALFLIFCLSVRAALERRFGKSVSSL